MEWNIHHFISSLLYKTHSSTIIFTSFRLDEGHSENHHAYTISGSPLHKRLFFFLDFILFTYNSLQWIYSPATLGLLYVRFIVGGVYVWVVFVDSYQLKCFGWKPYISGYLSRKHGNVKNWEAFELFIDEKVFNGYALHMLRIHIIRIHHGFHIIHTLD